MRVLGIDPGSRVTGFGVVESRGGALCAIDHGCVRIAAEGIGPRLGRVFEGVGEVIERTRPDVLAIEKVFMARNPSSALLLGQARGAAICAAVTRGLDVAEYSALEVKQAVVGNGRAAKEQVQHMVRVLLDLTRKPPSDAADALACAICYINTVTVTSRLAAAMRS